MIPVNEPLLGKAELKYVSEAIETNWISSEGRFIREFEAGFASYCGRRHGIAVNNGTSALMLAMRALNLPAGSEVIMPSFTIISCALACIYNDLVPVFVDSDPRLNLDPEQVLQVIGPQTRAIMPVHIYGQPADMETLEQIAREHSLVIVEDFAEAIGSRYHDRMCGSFGEVSCASFYANKTLTTGEGGMCLTDDDQLAEELRKLRNLAFIPERRFVHEQLGFNFRMTNIQAAIGLAQLERIEQQVESKIQIGETYNALLAGLEEDGKLHLPPRRSGVVNTYWMYPLMLTKNTDFDAVVFADKLRDRGIQTRPFFYPLHLQPAFEQFSWHRRQSLPECESAYRRGLYIPSGLTLTRGLQEQVAEAVVGVLAC